MQEREAAYSLVFFLVLLAQPVQVAADMGDVLAVFLGGTIFLTAACAAIGWWSRMHYNTGSGPMTDDPPSLTTL